MIITIFDFDDTLFPTSHLIDKRKFLKDEYIFDDKQINKLCSNLKELYKISKNNSDKLHIITNAEKSWVQQCLKKFLYNCSDIFLNIEIISSVDEGFSHNRDRGMWKTYTFIFKLFQYFGDGKNHELLAFGDCIFDREASMNIKKVFPNVTVKNITLLSKPNIHEFLIEQEAMIHTIENLYKHKGEIDYKLTLKNM